MPSNLIIFDAEYVSELTSRMNMACDLMADAVSSLRSAQSHENWKCKERNRILEDFDELNQRLGRLDTGVNETTRILGGSVSRFASLESQYESQANGLSDELTNNYGFSASVRTDGGASEGMGAVSGGGAAAGGAAGAGAGAAGAGAGTGAGAGGRGHGGHGRPGAGGAGGHGAGAGIAGRMAGHIPGGRPGNHNTGPSTGAGGTLVMNNVNLPVTHIPDNPDAAAKGIKDTREIAQEVISSVAQTMRDALSGHGGHGGAAPQPSASHLAEAYNAGRTVFESSAVIMASPTQPHTTERLAMAAGLVTLAGTATGAGITILGQATATVTVSSSSAGAGKVASGGRQPSDRPADFAQNAGHISEALQDTPETKEFKQVLGVFSSSGEKTVQSSGIIDLTGLGSSSSSGSSGKKGSFFDMIVAELKQALTGGQNGSGTSSLFSASSAGSTGSSSSMSASSPIMEFLGNFVMDQAV